MKKRLPDEKTALLNAIVLAAISYFWQISRDRFQPIRARLATTQCIGIELVEKRLHRLQYEHKSIEDLHNSSYVDDVS